MIKVYIDEDISPLLVKILKNKGFDAVSAAEVGIQEKKDEQHLAYANQENRVIITFNKKDFLKLAQTYPHKGIILYNQVSLLKYAALAKKIAEKLILIREWSNLLIWL